MRQYKLLDFPSIDFQLYLSKGAHVEDVPQHTHDFTELTIITDGTALHSVEEQVYEIQRGCVSAIIPSFSHSCTQVKQLAHYNFMFDSSKLLLLDGELERFSGFQSFFITEPYHRYRRVFTSSLTMDDEQLMFASSLCEKMFSEFSQQAPGFEVVVKTYFLSLVVYISRIYMPKVTISNNNFFRIAHTIRFIEEHFAQKIMLSELAQMTYLSTRQYSRIFREIYGCSPIDYVITCRLNNACSLIKKEKHTLTEIAHICGFTGKAAFSRMFKNIYKVSPSEYRNQCRKQSKT